MKKVIILKGLPASGKTTFARELIDKKPGQYKRINKDDLRLMLDNGKWSKNNEKFVLETRNDLIYRSLLNGYSVIVDDTNLHQKHELTIKEIITELNKELNDNIQVETKFFNISIEDCIKRDLKRKNSVGEKVIRNMYNQFLKPEPEKYQPDTTKTPAIICDIDGTLAEMTDRSPYDYSKIDTDILKKPIFETIKAFYQSGYSILLLSGRDSVCREQTEDWLVKNNVDFYSLLLMREENDIRRDSIIKKELFDKFIRYNYNVNLVLDDRDQVVESWRLMGLTCLQVDYGDF